MTPPHGPALAALAADALLAVHVLLAGFNVLALPAIWIGAWAGRAFASSRWFRGAHLGCMGVVAALALLGEACPLTSWENALRARAGQAGYQGSFLRHWTEGWFWVDAPEEAFAAAYAAWFLLVFLTLRAVPVRWRG
ncbi:MAG: DUF2784 domain-containing protein [Desulfovibrionaceae bacterium]